MKVKINEILNCLEVNGHGMTGKNSLLDMAQRIRTYGIETMGTVNQPNVRTPQMNDEVYRDER